MHIQVLLAVDDVEKHRVERIIIFARVVAYDDVFQFFKFDAYRIVLIGKCPDAIILVVFALKQASDVGKHALILVSHVLAHLAHVVVIELQNQKSDLVVARAVDSLDDSAAYRRQVVVEKVRVSAFQVVDERG